jgi:hypothetical protein
MEDLEIIYGILIGLLTESILRVIDYRGKIKEKLLTPFLMKLNKIKSKIQIDLSDPPVVACAKCKSAYWNRDRNTFFNMEGGQILDKQ